MPEFVFADGTPTGLFETYFLLTNIAGAPATVTLTYRTAAGAVIGSDQLVIPAYGRGTVWANGTTGGQDFTTEVTSTQEVMAERAMYWPTGASGLLAGPSESLAHVADASGGLAETGSEPPAPYTLTEGVPGPVIPPASPDPPAVVVGKRPPTSRTTGEMESQSSSGPGWYGSHLVVGKKP